MSDQQPCCNGAQVALGAEQGCCGGVSRRSFLQASSLTVLGTSSAVGAFAGPFEFVDTESDQPIPEDKKLSAQWRRSLTQRGEPEVYRGEEQLKYIGMPVGGICCGQLYLGGDGRLWVWDIFQNLTDEGKPRGTSAGPHYRTPPDPNNPGENQSFGVRHGFALQIGRGEKAQIRTLDRHGFKDVSFRGEYPIGRVKYQEEGVGVEVWLEAFSPFIPTDAKSSAMPATVLSYTVKNKTQEQIEANLLGYLGNYVCPTNHQAELGLRVNSAVVRPDRTTVAMQARALQEKSIREPILIADFEGSSYEGWTVEGDAFGDRPYRRREMPGYHNVSRHKGEAVANSHNARVGKSVAAADALKGKLTSEPFQIERRYLTMRVSGGRHPGKTCVNLLIDGQIVETVTGHNSNIMRSHTWDLEKYAGEMAQLEIIDDMEGPWGHIGVDNIVLSDLPAEREEFEDLPGYGSMALSLLEGDGLIALELPTTGPVDQTWFEQLRPAMELASGVESSADFAQHPVSGVAKSFTLGPGESTRIDFVISWWFPYLRPLRSGFDAIEGIDTLNRHYENWFASANGVAAGVAQNQDYLLETTRLWNKVWYDSTLPYWFLDRTFIPLCNLATQTCFWFDNWRFWAWEGVYCCAGTCTHVWNYAQGVARIFPELERVTREMVDYGLSLEEDGEIWYRGEVARHVAHDGQLGVILRAYREHTCSPDDAFLKRNWPGIRRSIEYMIAQDKNEEGLLRGMQYNTLDQSWYGPMGWISSMYLAALEAGKAMASEMRDESFAKRCEKIIAAGKQNLIKELFNGEYFIHRPPDFKSTNTNDGCHIDQLFGESLALQGGLPSVVSREESQKALDALWRYNFAPDAGGFRNQMQQTIPGGRWYAMPGEAGTVMCTWPRGGAEKAAGEGVRGFVAYFNECWTGQEYQLAAHMLYQAQPDSELVERGLAITRAVHDRHLPQLRNPYNEIECSDHYARALASYGVFLGACGFRYHGPRGEIAFAPRINPQDFRAPFTTAEGWGTFHQKVEANRLVAGIELLHGHAAIGTVSLELCGGIRGRQVTDVQITGYHGIEWSQQGEQVRVQLPDQVGLAAGEQLQVSITVS